jgi:hypothetical protein
LVFVSYDLCVFVLKWSGEWREMTSSGHGEFREPILFGND